jgi:hypothetical protein
VRKLDRVSEFHLHTWYECGCAKLNTLFSGVAPFSESTSGDLKEYYVTVCGTPPYVRSHLLHHQTGIVSHIISTGDRYANGFFHQKCFISWHM